MIDYIREERWLVEIRSIIRKPKLRRHVSYLRNSIIVFEDSIEDKNPSRHCDSVLCVCRNSRSIHIDTGGLERLTLEIREFVGLMMQNVVDRAMPHDAIASQFRNLYREAIENIQDRLNDIDKEFELVIAGGSDETPSPNNKPR